MVLAPVAVDLGLARLDEAFIGEDSHLGALPIAFFGGSVLLDGARLRAG